MIHSHWSFLGKSCRLKTGKHPMNKGYLDGQSVRENKLGAGILTCSHFLLAKFGYFYGGGTWKEALK